MHLEGYLDESLRNLSEIIFENPERISLYTYSGKNVNPEIG